jgi:hypothetical protein
MSDSTFFPGWREQKRTDGKGGICDSSTALLSFVPDDEFGGVRPIWSRRGLRAFRQASKQLTFTAIGLSGQTSCTNARV